MTRIYPTHGDGASVRKSRFEVAILLLIGLGQLSVWQSIAEFKKGLRAHCSLASNTPDASPNANHGTPRVDSVFQLLAGRNRLIFDGRINFVEAPNSSTLGSLEPDITSKETSAELSLEAG